MPFQHNEVPKTTASREPVQVAAGLIVRDGRYLLAKRKAHVRLGGLWEFPGGKREHGESLEACLRRELREELGIEITHPELFQTIRHDYPDYSVELHFYRCSIASGEVRSLDCERIAWALPWELTKFEVPPGDRSLIMALQHEALGS